jgi:hypothetical protein
VARGKEKATTLARRALVGEKAKRKLGDAHEILV